MFSEPRTSARGTLAVFTQCAAICVMSLLAWVWKGLLIPGTTVNLNLLQVGSALAVFVFGFDGVVNLPSIRGQMLGGKRRTGSKRAPNVQFS